MRQWKFRYVWKRKSDGHIWMEIVPIGCLEICGDSPLVHKDNSLWELIGRDLAIGVTDKDNVDVYENDKLREGDKIGKVEYLSHRFLCVGESDIWVPSPSSKIIGTVYESPELTGEKTK